MPSESAAEALISYIAASPTPYHAVATTARMLRDAGFRQVDELERFSLQPGDCGFVTRGASSLIAFRIGTKPSDEAGFSVIGAHTDSPNLRIKPKADLVRSGYRQLGVEVYGGALLSTWFDRDLSLAGRVVVSNADGSRSTHLIDLRKPLLRIPTLAIHLNRNVNTDGFVINAQQHLAPILALETSANVGLLSVINEALRPNEITCDANTLLGFDLCLYDTQPPTISGASGEFIHSARLDNLASCFSATQALVNAPVSAATTRVIALYDHEEVGSVSAQGADSPLLRDTLSRITHELGGVRHDAFPRAMARSFAISADMAHGVHPNYADRHEPGHQPILGNGPVIKTNANLGYATDGESLAHFVHLCRKADVVPQHFVTRSDLGCGSTIGPLTAGQLGLPAVDIGNPMLSMHSIREMAATADVEKLAKVFAVFFGAP
jgi:aspartyl aminopeptidase